MDEYVTHYYRKGVLPFRTLSGLSEDAALKIMEELCDDSLVFSRFKEPREYMRNRLEVEEWVRDEFIEKGGMPRENYPLYAVLGRSEGIEEYASQYDLEKICLPISLFEEADISFTVPDSMASFGLARAKAVDLFIPEYHGHVFTLSEIKCLSRTELDEVLGRLPDRTIPYVEVQIWNHSIPLNFCEDARNDTRSVIKAAGNGTYQG